MELLTAAEGEMAVHSARGTIEHVVGKKPVPELKLTPVFKEKRGVFVTLTMQGELRGCIGLPYPVMPLGEAIVHAAEAAAREDPRFPPVHRNELDAISVEVTILTVPVPLEGDPATRPERVIVGKHGLIIRGMGTSGLLLPQVATEQGWDREAFLAHSCRKAGLPVDAWRLPETRIEIFSATVFQEIQA